jgi:hypothetical protein
MKKITVHLNHDHRRVQLVHEGSDGTTQENNYYQVKETTMPNATINMELTPREALIIETIRSIASYNDVVNTDVQKGDELMKKYMDMDDNEFIDHYAEAVGDDVILSVLQDSLNWYSKWGIIFDSIDEDVIDELFEAYVSVDAKRELFLETQDREELCVQLVDLTMDGDWTPEN